MFIDVFDYDYMYLFLYQKENWFLRFVIFYMLYGVVFKHLFF